MKPIAIVLIILIGIVAYSLFDQYLSNGNLSGNFQAVERSDLRQMAEVGPLLKPKNNPNPIEIENKKPDVRISGLQATSYYSPSIITLSVRPQYGEKINITSWKIKARKGEIVIPQGIEKYQSHRDAKDIIIQDYARIYIINDSNPLGRGKNFCLNKCFGYLGFNTYCPRPKLEEITHLNPYCQEFILQLSRCEIPDYSNNMKISLDSKCVSYLNDNFNYSACFKKYSKDEDFLLNYWYVYTGTDIVHKLHDTVYLYDSNGVLIDKYTY